MTYVLDLDHRLCCRECNAEGRISVVAVNWAVDLALVARNQSIRHSPPWQAAPNSRLFQQASPQPHRRRVRLVFPQTSRFSRVSAENFLSTGQLARFRGICLGEKWDMNSSVDASFHYLRRPHEAPLWRQ